MKKLYDFNSIEKSNNPEKLTVFHASNSQHQIRFYINRTQFIAATELKVGCKISLDEEKEEYTKNSILSKILENPKYLFKIVIISCIVQLLFFYFLLFLINNINNSILLLFTMISSFFIMLIINNFILELITTSNSLKSKHAAEHMMVNFLENNKRLPHNIEEVKKYSRFSQNCGSRFLIIEIIEDFMRSIIAFIGVTFINEFIIIFFHHTLYFADLFFLYLFVDFVLKNLISKLDKLNFILIPIEKLLNLFIQCANTTSKVKNNDILLAYSVVRRWIKIVYPEFYNVNDDNIFYKQYYKC